LTPIFVGQVKEHTYSIRSEEDVWALCLEDVCLKLCNCCNPWEVVNLLLSLLVGQSIKGVSIRWCVWQERNKANHQEKKWKIPSRKTPEG
jgi:hypothetical protein